ncbi:TetR/AcrR family transcriptional regulator [Nocardia sp. NPDC050712]|uniref:TetR/AcrR family transcriptional regulator n=1 Tax=Nocardia sp. NPDC050712 TaxID=3155518 RepID=UPI0033DA4117
MREAGTWGGRTAAERRAERRKRLLDAAIEIWQRDGWAAVTMRGVCGRAALNDRYFYAEFGDLDQLLVAVWEHTRDGMLSALTVVFAQNLHRSPYEITTAAAEIVVGRIADDPGAARILFMHHGGSPALEQCRTSALQMVTGLVVAAAQPHLRPGADRLALRMDAVVAVGGFVELLSAWQAGVFECDGQAIVAQAGRLVSAFGDRYLTAPATS